MDVNFKSKARYKKIVKYFELFWSRLVSKFEKVPLRGNFKKAQNFMPIS
jgi:hypothetical protein